MATETTNLKLTKPALDDYVLVSDINENSDKIDNAHAEVSSAITTLTTSVNDTNTALDNHKADYVAHPGYADATGTNAYSVSLKPAAKSLVKGLGVVFTVANDATGNCTLNVNGLGAKAIMSSDGEQITDLKKGVVYTVRYNGTSFTLQGKGGGLDTLKIMQWLATTEPFKSSGIYLYNSSIQRIVAKNGSIYDTGGNILYQILGMVGFRMYITTEYIIRLRTTRGMGHIIVQNYDGTEVYNSPLRIEYEDTGFVGYDHQRKEVILNYNGKVMLYDSSGNLVSSYSTILPSLANTTISYKPAPHSFQIGNRYYYTMLIAREAGQNDFYNITQQDLTFEMQRSIINGVVTYKAEPINVPLPKIL